MPDTVEIQASFSCHKCKIARHLTINGKPSDADSVLKSLEIQLQQKGWLIDWGGKLLGPKSDMAGLIVALCPDCHARHTNE